MGRWGRYACEVSESREYIGSLGANLARLGTWPHIAAPISHTLHYAYHTDLAARTDATHGNHITVIDMSSRPLHYHHFARTLSTL